MKLSHAKFASVLAAAYVSIVAGGMLLHFVATGDFGTLIYSLMLPATLIAILTASVVAFGLWRGHAWAWWLGLIAASTQLIRLGSWLLARLNSGSPPLASWIIAFLLAAFLGVLLVRTTRRQCSR